MRWKLSPSAKILMLQAQEEAKHLEQSTVAYPHIELALLRFDGYAEQLLRNEGYDTKMYFLGVQNITSIMGCDTHEQPLHDSCLNLLEQIHEQLGAKSITVFHILLKYFQMLEVQDSSPMFGTDLVTGSILRKLIKQVQDIISDTKKMDQNEKAQMKQLEDSPEFIDRLVALGFS